MKNIDEINKEIRFRLFRICFIIACFTILTITFSKLQDIANNNCNTNDINTKAFCDMKD